jgi:hypothetical protein
VVATFPSATNIIKTSSANAGGQISASALKQIGALEAEKSRRTPIQQKIDSHLLYADKMRRGESVAEGVPTQRLNLDQDNQGRILVDIKADVSQSLLERIAALGGNVISSYPEYRAIQAGIPLSEIESVAAQKEVAFIQPVVHAIHNNVDSEGDYTHQANTARANFGVNGTGVKVGVISDSVDNLSTSQINGLVTVLPGQDGMPATGEGTAMLEIVNDLAPGAQLYFATYGTSEAQCASNIRNLRSTYGCDIIVDDGLFFDESPFQDGIVAQAVNAVTASGAMYFSSAGNSGNKDDGTSGTWEGDFLNGGVAGTPVNGKGGFIHSFGSANYDTVTKPSSINLPTVLFWSDPLNASTNDYDLFVLDPTGTSIVDSSTTTQNGTQDPYEAINPPSAGELVVVVLASGTNRFLHLDTERGQLAVSTQGSTRGHDCATNAFNVAATDAKKSYPNPFTGGAFNPVETFSSDGTRRVFFQADGTPITPGNFSSSGGAVRQKPDITAADDITTDVPGFAPFTGTSAAAPHAAAIAALLKSYNQNLTPSQIRTIFTNTAFDIMTAGVDRDSGAGIVMALPALQQSPVPTPVTAPASIVGKAMGGIITSGDYPFVASGGYFLLIPSNSGSTCQLVEVDDDVGIYSIVTGNGTYSYSASGSTGLLQLNGSDTLVGNFNFSTTNMGTYLLTNVSVAPIVASQTGEYELYQAAVPASIAGKTFRCFIQNGVSPFAVTGTFDFKVAASGAGYAIVDSETGITNSTGTYSYSKPNSSTGQVQLNDSVVGTATDYIVFSDAFEGTFLATQASSGGFQVGHFVLLDTTSPSVNILFPTAGARLTNALITAQGTATDGVQVARVGYQLNTNGWQAATGSTNWTAANLMLAPGTNTFSAYAVDTSGNISTTNQVSFVYVLSAVLTVQTNGIGSISPNYNGAFLQIGSNYMMTATAGTGFSFTNWTGSITTNGATLKFIMASNLTFTANFIDTNKPVLSITNLTAGQRLSNAVFTVMGTAGDNWLVSNVWYQLNGLARSNAVTANAWTNWSALLNLVPGTNSIQAYAVDSSGNVSTTNSVNFDFVVTNQLQIRTVGLGTISPNDSNAWLEIGRNYSITSAPVSGFVFTNWLVSTNWIGGALVTVTNLQFMMQSNLTLLATFLDVTKPTLTITAPTANQKMTNALATVIGTAADNWQVSNVWYQLNGGVWSMGTTTNSFTNWTSPTLTLIAGTNSVKAYALDLAGNVSITNSVSFVSSNAFKLQMSFALAQPLTTIGLNFSLQISPGLNGHIQVSTNLATWATLTNFVGTNTTLNFRDPAATNSSHRFYRSVIP